MPTKNRSEVRIDAKIEADFGVADWRELDVFDTETQSLCLTCPICHFTGAFGRALVERGKRRAIREYTCPVCNCIIRVTIRI